MSNFNEVMNYLNSQPSSKKKGDAFEVYSKWYLENDPTYSKILKQVWLWKDWSGQWGPEHGIDLVAETHQGKFWAIQAKAYSENNSVSKYDINRFLSESSRAIFSFRLIIATTNNFDYSGRRVIEGQEKPVGIVRLHNLIKTPLLWPKSIDTHRSIHQKKQTPKPHQNEAIEKIIKGFEKADRGQLIMACGTGKTNVGLWVAEKMKAQKILVLVPSLSLLSQTLQKWAINSSKLFRFLPVCSDDSVTNEDKIVTHIYELGFPATTKAKAILQFFDQKERSVIFSTYQSSPEVAKACVLGNIELDLIIADEAHRCAGNYSKKFATILKKDSIRAKKRLFMTATPKIFRNNLKQMFKNTGNELISMDDPDKFGEVLYKLSLAEAIEKKLLSDYRVGIIAVDDSLYDKLLKKRKLVTTDGKKITDAKSLAAIVAVAFAMHKYDLTRLLSFHSTVKGAKNFSKEFQSLLEWIPQERRPSGAVLCDYVEGKMSAFAREKKISCLKDLGDYAHAILSNARCLSEGIDLPELDGIVFVDTKKSQIDIVQTIGRAIRKSDAKNMGTIIIPIVVQKGEDYEAALDKSEYKHIWNVLKALRSHDETLGGEVDLLRQELGRKGFLDSINLTKIFIDLPSWVSKDFAQAIELRIINQTSMGWEFYFGLLERYITMKGHSHVPSNFMIDGYNLGSWLSVQRKEHRAKRLTQDRIERLQAIPYWTWNKLESDWQKGFSALKDYFQRTKYPVIPQDLVIDGINLFHWATVQRKTFKNGKIRDDRKQQLESLPLWYWNYFDTRLMQGQEALTAFLQREGHLRIPTTHIENNFPLGLWVKHKKNLYSQDSLPNKETKFFESFKQWSWKNLNNQLWFYGYSLLEKFVKLYGHAQSVSGFKLDGFNLGTWIKTQREAYSKNRLSKDKIEKLLLLPNWSWQIFDDRNKQGFETLDSFVKREGHALVLNSHIENGFHLGQWISQKRQAHKNPNSKNKLTGNDRKKLESYPWWFWDGTEGRWERGKHFLLKFIDREGLSRVKNSHLEDGFELGKWLGIWRHQYKKKMLPEWKIEFFESQPGWSWDVKADQWNYGLEKLKKYVERESSADVPTKHLEEGFNLGTWVCTQRHSYAKQSYGKKLSQEKINILESLPDWKWTKVDEKWNLGLKYLNQFVKINGHSNIPAKFKIDGYSLGIWSQGQKYAYKRRKLSKDRISILEKFPGWNWNFKQDKWNKAYDILLAFYREKKTARVPFDYIKNDFRLGEWILTQRKSYKAGKMSDERKNKLSLLNGWSWNTRE